MGKAKDAEGWELMRWGAEQGKGARWLMVSDADRDEIIMALSMQAAEADEEANSLRLDLDLCDLSAVGEMVLKAALGAREERLERLNAMLTTLEGAEFR